MPRPDQNFFGWVKNFGRKIAIDPQRYSIPQDLADEYAQALNTFSAAFLRALDPSSRTKAANSGKDAARIAMDKIARACCKCVRADKSVTPAMRIELGMNIRNGGGYNGRLGTPGTLPLIIVRDHQGTRITLEIRDTASNRACKPHGVHTAMIMSYVGADPNGPLSNWATECLTSSCRTTLTLKNSDVGRYPECHLAARWVSPRGHIGPISNATVVNISGSFFLKTPTRLAA